MYNISSYNKGKSFCNLIANKIIDTISSIDPSHKTKITVTDHGNFIILNGYTSIMSGTNFSTIITEYLEPFNINRTLNFIDLINYQTSTKENTLFRKISRLKYDTTIESIYSNLVETDGFDISVDTEKKLIYYYDDKAHNHMIDDFSNFTFIKSISKLPSMSDPFYGSNLDNEKIYDFYFKYIAYNIFEKQLCKDITLDISFDTNDIIDHENISFTIDSRTKMTSNPWLRSMILDLFHMNQEVIIEKFDLKNYDFENEIMLQDKKLWSVRDMTQEMILF